MYSQNPKELVADPKGSAKQTVGNTGGSDKILFFGGNIKVVICLVRKHG
jgi:hypothetical protein